MHSLLYNLVFSKLPDKWVENFGGLYYKLASYFTYTPMIDLPVTIMGVEFPNPIGMSAGWIDNPDKLKTVHRLGVGIPTIKTITQNRKEGNPYPRIVREGKSMINSLGLPNKGIEWWVENYEAKSYPTIISIKGDTIDQWRELILKVQNLTDIIELNLSCPNVGDGVIDLDSSEEIINNITDNVKKKILLKLSPEFSPEENLQLIKRVYSKIDGVTAINTQPVINEQLGNPTNQGGKSGDYLYPHLCRHLTTLRSEYPSMSELPIFATGGINSSSRVWQIISDFKCIPMGLTGFLTDGPRYYYKLVKHIQNKLEENCLELKTLIFD